MRLFHKFTALNTQFFGLVDNIMISTKPYIGPTKTIEYLKKYSYVFDNVQKIETSDKYQNKIWQLWLQGEDKMPPIIRGCTNSIKKYYNDDIIFLTQDNIKEYVELPDYINEKYKKGIIRHAHYADIVRLYLLAKYGGCWMDATIYLTGEIPNDIKDADFFTFRYYDTHVFEHIENYEQFRMYCNNLRHSVVPESLYFMVAKPGQDIINYLLALLFEYWKHENSACDYLFIDKFFDLVLIYNKELREQYLNMPKYYIGDLMLLQKALFEHFDEELFNNIKHSTNIHKLTHKNLKRSPYKDSFLEYIINNK